MLRLLTQAQVSARTWIRDREEGASAVEYGLLIGLIALVVIGAVTLLGGQLSTLFTNVKNAISGN